MKITAVYPTHGLLYSTSTFGMTGVNLCVKGAITYSKPHVLVGGRDCPVTVISSDKLVFTVPPWAAFPSTNDLPAGSNKLDVVVINTMGAAVTNNALSFDLTLPNDAQQGTLTPQEEQIEKMIRGVFYTARVMNTNPVVKTGINLSASAGDKSSEKDTGSALPMNFTVSVSVNTNKAAAADGAKTNGPASSP